MRTILVIGSEQIKQYIRDNIETANTNYSVKSLNDVNAEKIEKLLKNKKVLDTFTIIFSFTELKTVEGIGNHLKEMLKSVSEKERLVIIDLNNDLSGIKDKIEKKAIIINSFESIPYLEKKEIKDELDDLNFDDFITTTETNNTNPNDEFNIPNNTDENQQEILANEIEKLLSNNENIFDSGPRENKSVSSLQPEMPILNENNDDFLSDILNNYSEPSFNDIEETPINLFPEEKEVVNGFPHSPSDDILNSLFNTGEEHKNEHSIDINNNLDDLLSPGINSKNSTSNSNDILSDILNQTNTEQNLPNIFQPNNVANENSLESILSGNTFPFNDNKTGTQISLNDLSSNNPLGQMNNMGSLQEEDTHKPERSKRGITRLIDSFIGGKVGKTDLPAISNDALPNNLKRPYVITFWASKGGTGKTTVALNTCAYISALTNLNVVLLDVDEFGDTGLSVGLGGGSGEIFPTVDDFINHITTIHSREDAGRYILAEAETGLNIILTSENSSTPQRPTKTDYEGVIKVLEKYFDIIAFDCGDKLYDPLTQFAITKADFIIMVIDQGVPTIANISEVINNFSQSGSGIGRDRLILVVNKFQKNVGMSVNDIRSWFESSVSSMHSIPAIFQESLSYLNQGKLIILSEDLKIKEAYNNIVSDILLKIKIKEEQNI